MADEQEPRRPRNMQGLLNFCTQLTIREDAPSAPTQQPMDPQRREFLQTVMSSLTVSHAKQMAGHLQTLARSQDIHEGQADPDTEMAILDDLVEIVQDVDNANDLVKMGGVPVLLSCLDAVHPCIIEGACEVLGVVSQNNPISQDTVLNCGTLPSLLTLLDTHSAMCVKAKALYAVSCLVRGFMPAMEAFDKQNGFSHLMRAMQESNEKLFVKAIFLITALIEEYKPTTEQLLLMGYTELLINYLCSGADLTMTTNNSSSSESPCHTNTVTTVDVSKEHCAAALLKLCTVSHSARTSCADNDALTEYLKQRVNAIGKDEEYQEECDHITELLKLFSDRTAEDEHGNAAEDTANR